MAVYILLNSGIPVKNATSTIQLPPGGTGGGANYILDSYRVQTFPNINNQTSVINSRYKVGGTTGWERPGSDLA